MIFTGINFKSVPTTHEITLELGSISHLTSGDFYSGPVAITNFGFSGDSEGLNFSIKNNKLIDPEGRAVYGFNTFENLDFRLNVNTGNYEYYINNELVCASGIKNDFEINKFYINCDGTSLTCFPFIRQAAIDYSLSFATGFNVSGELTGTFINNSNSEIIIYSGEIVSDSYTVDPSPIQNILVSGNSSGNFILNNVSSEFGVTYLFGLKLHTNFGEITERFQSKAI